MNPPELIPQPLRQFAPASAHAPPAIPDHELLRRIGHGAYGEVWLARSATGAYRAVKVVYRDTFEDGRPFEREFSGIVCFEPISRTHESQIDILHVGRDEEYFYYVMELADDLDAECTLQNAKSDGEPKANPKAQNAASTEPRKIDPASYSPRTLKSELLRRGKLSFDECVQISLALTTALEHLHTHGLVHRDVKPSNIVFVHGVPKLADIGLVTGVDATRSLVGTEGFAPPEGPGTPQADLYSLGKVLYEMCTGKDRQEFPELPTDLDQLPEREGLLELNAVIAKACREDPRARYQSAKAMHDELLILQNGKSLARLRRVERAFLKLKRVSLAAAVLAVLAAGAFIWQSRQTRQMSELASNKQEVAKFLDDMLASVSPSVSQGRDTAMLREILNKASERVAGLKSYPQAEAELRLRLGSTYRELGDYAQAEAMLRESLRVSKLQASGPVTVAALRQLGAVLQAKGDLPAAEAACREGLTTAKQVFGVEHARVAELLRDLAKVLIEKGDPGAAEAMVRQALHIAWMQPAARPVAMPDASDMESATLDTLASIRANRADLTGAERLWRRSLAIRQRLFGAVDTRVAEILNHLARVQLALGNSEQAEATYAEVLAMERKLYADPHPAITQTMADLAHVEEQNGKVAEAEQLSRQALNSARTLHGEAHPTVASCLRNLGLILWKQGDWTAAGEMFKQELAIWRKLGGHAQASVAALEINARFSAFLGHPAQAEDLWLEYIDGLGTANERPLRALESMLMKPALKPVLTDAEEAPQPWRYTGNLKEGWQRPDFDDSSWALGQAPFGSWDHFGRTPWPAESITLRRVFDVPAVPRGELVFRVDHDDDVVVFLNGFEAASSDGWSINAYECLPCSETARATLRPGRNVLAVQCRNISGGTCIDVGLYATSDMHLGKRRVIERLRNAIEQKPTSAGLRLARADLLAGEGRWREAAEDAQKGVELDPSNVDWRHLLAPLLVQLGELAKYDRLCRDSLERFTHTTTPHEGWQTVSDCLLVPRPALEPQAIERLMGTALAANPQLLAPGPQFEPGLIFTKALAEYRQGRYASAVSWSEKVLPSNGADPPTYFVLAMAKKRLGKGQEARATLAKGMELMRDLPPLDSGNLGPGWLDLIYDHVLLREAQQALLNP